MPIFVDADDRKRFLSMIGEVVERHNWRCYAYCLMDNHYHLLVETVDGPLSHGMRQLNGVYTQHVNRRHNRVGHLFQGRFKSILVERESHLLQLCRYVVLNPVRAGMVEDVEQFPWSSYRATVGLTPSPAFLTVDWILGQFSDERSEARRQYREFVLAGIADVSPWKKLKGGCILGGKEFVNRLNPQWKEKPLISEIPRRERFVFRPELKMFLGEELCRNKDERNTRIAAAHHEFGYTFTEIARHLRLHYSTVSKVVKGRPRRPT